MRVTEYEYQGSSTFLELVVVGVFDTLHAYNTVQYICRLRTRIRSPQQDRRKWPQPRFMPRLGLASAKASPSSPDISQSTFDIRLHTTFFIASATRIRPLDSLFITSTIYENVLLEPSFPFQRSQASLAEQRQHPDRRCLPRRRTCTLFLLETFCAWRISPSFMSSMCVCWTSRKADVDS